MSGRRQGVRSSRTGPVTKRDRDRLRMLDRKIGFLDKQIGFYGVNGRFCRNDFYRKLFQKHKEKRLVLDQQRKELRHWMKRVQ